MSVKSSLFHIWLDLSLYSGANLGFFIRGTTGLKFVAKNHNFMSFVEELENQFFSFEFYIKNDQFCFKYTIFCSKKSILFLKNDQFCLKIYYFVSQITILSQKLLFFSQKLTTMPHVPPLQNAPVFFHYK